MQFVFTPLVQTANRQILTIVKKIIPRSQHLYDPPQAEKFGRLADGLQNDFFVTGSEDGTVCLYSLETYQYDKMLVRCSLPIRDVALSPDGTWAAVASEFVNDLLS